MDAFIERILGIPEICNFMMRRKPEGVLSHSVLATAVSYAYTSGKTVPLVRAPSVEDTFVVHVVTDDGYALGEVMACSDTQPFTPTLNSVSTLAGMDAQFSTAATSRRFCADMNGANYDEFVEFAWMSDARLVVSWRWTGVQRNSPFALAAEVRVFPPTAEGELLSAFHYTPEMRLSVSSQICVACGASHRSHCRCLPSVLSKESMASAAGDGGGGGDLSDETDGGRLLEAGKTRPPPVRLRKGKTWAQHCDWFTELKTMGVFLVAYRTRLPARALGKMSRGEETLLFTGAVPYGASFSSGFPGDSEFRQQLQVYMRNAGATFRLLLEPKSESIPAALPPVDHAAPVETGEEVPEATWLAELDADAGEKALTLDLTSQPYAAVDAEPDFLSNNWIDINAIPEPTSVAFAVNDVGASSVSAAESSQAPYVPPPKPVSVAALGSGRTSGETAARGKKRVGDSNTVCSICGAKFTRPSNLRRHRQSLHMQVKKAHQCRRCDRSFFSAVELKRHVVKHDSPRPECKQCGLRFRLVSALDLHVAVAHSNERPFKCECGVAFARKSALDRHRKSVHQGHRHECPDCGASYSQPFDLKRHKSRTGHGKESVSNAASNRETVAHAVT